MDRTLTLKGKKRLASSIMVWALLTGVAVFALSAPVFAADYSTATELKIMQGFPPPPDKRVTKANALQKAPFNRWSYLHMRMYYPSAPVPLADKPVPLSKTIDWSLENNVKVVEPGTGKMKDLAAFMKESYTDALVVIRGDQIVYEKYFNVMHPNQPHQMMSVTKSFCGLLGLMAVEEGKLKESDLVTRYVPELKKAGALADATFGQVLDMTNSMNFTEDYADPKSGIRTYGATLGWTEPVKGVKCKESLYEYLMTLDIDKKHKHGEIFHCQTPKTDVVNWVTNRVNHQSFQDAMYEKLWSKLGTEGETYVLLDKNATLVAGGGLNATPCNLARFAIMMINGGQFNGRQIVPPTVIEKLAKGGSVEAFDKCPDSDFTRSLVT